MIQPTADELAGYRHAQIEMAKLHAVQGLVKVMEQANPVALQELLYRLTNSFKNYIITDPADTATPEQRAQALLVCVLLSAITTSEPEAPPGPAGQYAVIDIETHEVLKSFATEGEARDYLMGMDGDDRPPLSQLEIVDRQASIGV